MSVKILVGDCRESLATLPDESVQMCVTSPPYFGLRDYGTASWQGGDESCNHTPRQAPRSTRPAGGLTGGKATVDAGTVQRDCHCGAVRVDRQLGLEPTPAEYVEKMVEVFRGVKRVLRDDGTLWLNIGDSYTTGASVSERKSDPKAVGDLSRGMRRIGTPEGLKAKDLIGIPWMLAFALRADGWYLRSDIIWHKPNPMPESVTDRPTKSHEYLFLLSKSERYYYDSEAVREPSERPELVGKQRLSGVVGLTGQRNDIGRQHAYCNPAGRNARSVWTIATQPYSGAHFATFPPALIEPCIKAGSSDKSCEFCGKAWERQTESERVKISDSKRYSGVSLRNDGEDGRFTTNRTTLGFTPACDCGSVNPIPSTVLDPFGGAGTTGLVADRLGRNALLCELNPEYADLARNRIQSDNPLFVDCA